MMAESLMYLTSLGLSPTAIAAIAILWRFDKRVTRLEEKVLNREHPDKLRGQGGNA